MRGNPFDEFERMLERMNQQLGQFEGGANVQVGGSSASVDVADQGDEFVVTADLPGYDTEDIDLTLADDTVRIEAEREEEMEDEDEQYIRRERRHQHVSRSVPLPEAVDEDSVSASYNNGVLTVTLPKRHGVDDGHQIDIE
ncbi:Hsp20/alpha crystallin family protein [Natronoarchaeum rubrum]|uniref:Hsp20/alpha crystallin family protein n=1 Tax=Natronoarchaeum rubrum TaxID=755311 RepID=UPI0021138E14|nr:Hsp20/alpha crystallin family protein [Natronoarchaeum rubrum]HMB49891.1 Hsp20/alpha crystallin family protein [Natronoarchaeum rubrum]